MPQQPKIPSSPLGPLLHLLGAGVLGTILFAFLLILLAPVILGVSIYLTILRWRMKRALRRAAESFTEGGGIPGSPHVPGRKRVTVTVHPVAESDGESPA